MSNIGEDLNMDVHHNVAQNEFKNRNNLHWEDFSVVSEHEDQSLDFHNACESTQLAKMEATHIPNSEE